MQSLYGFYMNFPFTFTFLKDYKVMIQILEPVAEFISNSYCTKLNIIMNF